MPSILEITLSSTLWSALATISAMVLALPLAYVLARHEFRGKSILSTLTSLPLVLPPTAVGYLMLLLFSDNGLLGGLFDVLLTWRAVVLACSVMSLPLMVRTARLAFESVNPRLELMALTLGYSRLRTLFTITLPLAKRGLLAAAILGFTRSLGEFGATVMLAGNIPGRTQTLSSALYSAQQSGNHERASALLIVALCIGFAAVFFTEWLTRPTKKGNL